jgi:large subunit ribosomal protein L32e
MTKKDIIEQFSSIKGLGKAKAELLYNNGFDSLKKIQESKIEKLIKIKGINEKIAKDIKKQVNEIIKNTDNNDNKKPKKDTQQEKKSKKVDTKAIKKEETKQQEREEIDTKIKEKEVSEEQNDIDEKDKEKKYIVKKKPILTKDQLKQLKIRKQIKKRTPKFLREEWFRYKRIPNNWRRPDGITSKMRINLKYRPNKVRVGYRGPKKIRELHSSGFEEVLIHNIYELQNIDNKKQAIRIGSTVGTKKRIEIEKEAENLDIRILNIGGRKND